MTRQTSSNYSLQKNHLNKTTWLVVLPWNIHTFVSYNIFYQVRTSFLTSLAAAWALSDLARAVTFFCGIDLSNLGKQLLSLLRNLVDVVLLILSCHIHQRQVTSEWSDSISEVNEIKDHIAKGRKLWIELSLFNHSVLFSIIFLSRKVFKYLHESNTVSVCKVV